MSLIPAANIMSIISLADGIPSVIVYIFIGTAVIGLIFELTILFAVYKQGLKGISIDAQFILSLVMGDLIISVSQIIFKSGDIYHGGYSWMMVGCHVDSAILVYGVGISVLSVLSVTVNRILILKRDYRISQSQANLINGSIWIGLPAIILIFVLIDSFNPSVKLAVLQPSHVYCFIDATSTNPVTATVIIAVIFFIIGPMLFLIYSYSSFVLLFYHLRRARARRPLSVSSKEKRLMIKSIAITTGFLVCYGPYLLKMIIEATSHEPLTPVPDLVCAYLGIFSIVVNPTLLFFFDGHVGSSVRSLLFGPSGQTLQRLNTAPTWKKSNMMLLGNGNNGKETRGHDAGVQALDAIDLDQDDRNDANLARTQLVKTDAGTAFK